MDSRSRDLAALSLLAGLAAAFLVPAWVRGETFLALDNLLAYLPWSSLHPGAAPANPLITDPVNGLIYPVRHALRAGALAGELSLWNPRLLGGLIAAPPTNPLELVAALALSPTVSHDLLLALYLCGGLSFAFLFLRELGLGHGPSALGAIAFAFNGYAMAWFEFEWTALLVATLAASLFFIERWLRTRSAAAWLGLAASAALTVAADFVQILVYVWLLLGAWLLCRSLLAGGSGRTRWRAVRDDVLPLALAFAAALPVAASPVLAGSAALEGAQRQSLTWAELFRGTGQLPVEYLRTLVFPYFFGSPTLPVGYFTPRPGAGFPYNNPAELCVFVGAAPLLLAIASLPRLRRPPVAFFSGVAVVSVTMAMGSALYAPLALIFPGLDLTTPTRVLFLLGPSVAVLSAHGLELLLRGSAREKRLALALASLPCAAALWVVWQVQAPSGIARVVRRAFEADALRRSMPALVRHFDWASPVLLLPLLRLGLTLPALACCALLARPRLRAAAAGLLGALVVADLLGFARAWNTTAPRALAYPETPALAFLRDEPRPFRALAYGRFLHSSLAPFEIEDVGGYASFYSRRWAELLLAADVPGVASSAADYGVEVQAENGVRRSEDHVRLGSPLLDLLDARYVLTAPDTRLPDDGFALAFDRELRVWKRRDALPRAFFVGSYELAESEPAAWLRMKALGRDDLRRRVLLEAPPQGPVQALRGAPPADPAPDVRVIGYASDRLSLSVESPRPGFVVVANAFHPAWRARVNGESQAVERAFYALQAVGVAAGRSEIELEFAPTSLRVGLAIAAAGWLGLGAAGAVLAVRVLRRP